MQIPTITLEDLQSFQATHFPGARSPLQPPYPEAADSVTSDTRSTEEDDLGHYPDGVKRTLTDEQIRIFRHTEVHALLRKRQLEQDDAEYEARAGKRSLDEDASVEVQDRALDSSDSPVTDTLQQRCQVSPASGKRLKRVDHEVPDQPEQSLDYEDHHDDVQSKASVPAPASALDQTQRTRQAHPTFHGRKIISYDD
ncbi:hypothetical protein N7539_008357 [Penicillium diatomitis]|uniref:Uncharacterized protein n=1 Tax=Penicillium diatomitis TaxID=2819901 RepID=A0A9W9WU00_9EURO|nr:uncharacterized protein N7539_008357 [Penicillium diatomitis]KAJ5475291.1 hypothetical protein N7539_008357 [Penicillium diatomitis]